MLTLLAMSPDQAPRPGPFAKAATVTFRENRTTLIVSHRVSTIRDADLICVLADGRIIERGTHDELLTLDGEYADLYERQLLEEELEATD